MRVDLELFFSDVRFGLRHPVIRHLLLVLAGMTVVALLAVFAYLFPAWREHEGLEDSLRGVRRQIAEHRSHAELVKAVERANGEIERIEKKLDARGVQIALVNQLNQLARRDGIRIVSESYDEGKPQDGYAPLFHDLAVEGSYGGLRRFLADLERMSTFSIVREASIVPVRDGAEQLKAHLRMVTYRRVSDTGEAR